MFCYSNIILAQQIQTRSLTGSLTTTEQQSLSNLISQHIDANVLTDHCDASFVAGIHSDFDFLPFHRAYIQRLEDFLVLSGNSQFVPLPRWDPAWPVASAFQTIDPACTLALCPNIHSTCSSTPNWNPSIVKPSYLGLTQIQGSYNDLCDFTMSPTQPSSLNCCPSGLSAVIEGNPNRNYPVSNALIGVPGTPLAYAQSHTFLYHDRTHVQMGGVMGAPLSPSTPAFWVWHAYVDQVWKDWEDNCPNSSLSNYDLFMKDHPNILTSERDIGDEPSIYNGPQYLSYDIWCRNQNDGLTNATHQNPINDGINPTHVYVRVRNRGKYTSQGTEQLKLYWSKAATNLTWPQHWNGSITIPHPSGVGSTSMGDIITTLTIPQIDPMDQEILHFIWMPPDPSDYSSFNNEPHHFCLLARIDAPAIDPMHNEQWTGIWNLGQNVKNNNNIIWKNLQVIDLNPLVNDPNNPNEVSNAVNFYIGNTGAVKTFDLVLENLDRRSGNYLTQDAEVYFQMDQNLWNIWESEGFNSDGIDIIDPEEGLVKITNDPAKLIGIEMKENFFSEASIKVYFLESTFPHELEYDYNIRQVLTNTDSTLGGEGIKIYPPVRSGIIADAGIDTKISVGDSTQLIAADIGEEAEYNWYLNDEHIHSGISFYASPTIESEYILEVITLDAIKDYDKIKVGIKKSQILNISPNPAEDVVTIEYELESVTNANIVILRPYGGSVNYSLNLTQTSLQVDVSNFQSGLYYVSLICNGASVDSKPLIID